MLDTNITKDTSTFLVDTQADISIMKYNVLISKLYLNQSEVITIKGITEGTIASCGTIIANIFIQGYSIEHKFHIVPNEFNIPAEGILGKDFLKRFNCIMDYNNMTLTLKLSNDTLSIPILETPHDNIILLPTRCEVFRTFKIQNFHQPQVIPPQEIAAGVFIARTIAHTANPIVRVLNTTSSVKSIPKVLEKTENLSDYDIYTMNQNISNTDRKNQLKKILEKQIPEHAKKLCLPMCMEYHDIFALDSDQLTTNNFYKQTLRIKDGNPVYVKNYRLPKCQKEEIEKQVNKLLQSKLIEKSQSAYNSPLILVPKQTVNGEKQWRMCVDYRLVNKKLIADRFPLPRIDDILDSLGRTKYFSVLDLYSGFWQIELTEDSRDITSFSTNDGSFRWKVLPFGLSVSPSSFSRMMQLAFAGITPEQSFLYMDEMIVLGCSEKHHLSNLKKIFEVCRKYNLKLNPMKCNFFKPEILFLGHRCTKEGVLPDDRKIDVMRRYPTPTNKDETRRFVAFANYYRKFIKNFAEQARPLNRLTRKKVEFNWTKECELAFQTLRNNLSSPPILQYPNFSQPFYLTVDASKYACGAVLSQYVNGHDLPISFASKSFNKAESNKFTIERELLAIHFAITHYRSYLYGTEFIVRSDHKPLIYLYNLKKPSSKLTQIRLDLEEYNFKIEHIKGKENVAADALSRISIADLKQVFKTSVTLLPITRSMTRKASTNAQTNKFFKPDKNTNLIRPKVIEQSYNFAKKIPKMKTNVDTNFSNCKIQIYKNHKRMLTLNLSQAIANERLTFEFVFSKLQEAAKNIKIDQLQLSLDDNIFKACTMNEFKMAGDKYLTNLQIILVNKPKEVTNTEEKIELLQYYHNNPIYGGHCGQKKLYAKLRNNYYWKRMTYDIAKFIKNCEKCQHNKVRLSNKEPMILTKTSQKPFDVVIIDTVGPLPTSQQGNRYALTMICDLTKYLIVAPMPNKEASTIAKCILENFILIYGPMRRISTDMGSEFVNSIIKELCLMLQIDHRTSTAHRHQAIGTIERNHRVLNEYIRAYISNCLDQWENYIKYFSFCYNISYNSTLNHSYSPYELVFSSQPYLPNQLLDNNVDPLYNIDNYVKEAKYRLQTSHIHAQNLIDKAKAHNKYYYDLTSKPLHLKLNDQVYLKKEPYNKHDQIYSGPYIVKKIEQPNVEIFDLKTGKSIITHKDRLRKNN